MDLQSPRKRPKTFGGYYESKRNNCRKFVTSVGNRQAPEVSRCSVDDLKFLDDESSRYGFDSVS